MHELGTSTLMTKSQTFETLTYARTQPHQAVHIGSYLHYAGRFCLHWPLFACRRHKLSLSPCRCLAGPLVLERTFSRDNDFDRRCCLSREPLAQLPVALSKPCYCCLQCLRVWVAKKPQGLSARPCVHLDYYARPTPLLRVSKVCMLIVKVADQKNIVCVCVHTSPVPGSLGQPRPPAGRASLPSLLCGRTASARRWPLPGVAVARPHAALR